MADDGRSKAMKELLNLTKELQTEYKSNLDIEKQLADLQERRSDRQSLINQLQQNYNDLNNKQKKALNDLVKLQNNEYDTLKKLSKQQDEINKQLQKEIKARERLVDLAGALANALKEAWTFLQSQDKIIKSTILNLGMSGIKAEMMRGSFEQSAGFVARLGGSLEDIQGIMEGYADETGRARVLSAEMVNDIEMIGKGTGLGVEQATKLGAQFELMGIDAHSTMDYVQGVVDTSERMGVNTTKVLKNISDNFKKLQGYTFQQGVKGFAQMAQYAEKFKISIDSALNAADTARTLEGAIGMVAQLQVMGGEFAKMDMFETLFLARNDPAKLQLKIGELTKGIATLRKNSDGTFQKFISPADMDRLTQVGKALNISADEMKTIALRQLDISMMADKLQGMGLTDREKELIQGAAQFDTKTGKFQVLLAGQMRDISSLTQDQAKSFVKETVSLKERAKQAQTFDEVFKATINELKAALLPMLHGINTMLKPVAKIADWIGEFTKGSNGWWKAAGLLIVAGSVWKVASIGLKNSIDSFIKSGLGGKIGNIGKFGGAKGGGTLSETIKGGTASKGISGGAAAGIGAGVGMAALGVGAGIGIAAEGVSKLADAMSKLTPEQAKTLKDVVKSLGWFVLGGAALAASIIVIGVAAEASTVGLGMLALAALGIGTGIGIAAAGIGFMGMGLAKLVTAAKGAGPAMLDVGAGIAAISLAMMGFTFGALGFLTFAATMKTISKNADSLSKVGDAFKEINAVMSGSKDNFVAIQNAFESVSKMNFKDSNISSSIDNISKNANALKIVGEAFGNIKTVMSGSKDDFIAVQNAVESISKMNTSGGGMLANLATLLKSPIKFELANNGQVALQNDITLNLDGDKFMHKVYNTVIAIEKQQALKTGKAGK